MEGTMMNKILGTVGLLVIIAAALLVLGLFFEIAGVLLALVGLVFKMAWAVMGGLLWLVGAGLVWIFKIGLMAALMLLAVVGAWMLIGWLAGLSDPCQREKERAARHMRRRMRRMDRKLNRLDEAMNEWDEY